MLVSQPRLVAALSTIVFVVPVSAQVTQRVSVGSAGVEGNDFSAAASISDDARYVAFKSLASNLVAGDTNARVDVFVRDRQAGTTERVSVSSTGAQANNDCNIGTISGNGRFVVFWSHATNLVVGDTNGFADVFLRDRQMGTTELVSVDTAGGPANSGSGFGATSVSADGRYVAFESGATDLVAPDTTVWADVFVRDRQLGITEIVSVDSAGVQGNSQSNEPTISADGRYVAFTSVASNLVAGDTNGVRDVFVHDRQTGVTQRVSVSSGGVEGNGHSLVSGAPTLSADGRYVAFHSLATNLVSGDTNGDTDCFVRDRQLGITERVSVDSIGTQANDVSTGAFVSADGRYVAFYSPASNLVSADTNGIRDIFLRDRQTTTTTRININWATSQADAACYFPRITPDDAFIVFEGGATNLVPADANAASDVFLRDRFDGTEFTNVCDPGVAGVIACPCGNPPSGPGRGCNNSSGTGGAILVALGGPYLSSDSLWFGTLGEKPTALSIVSQWTGFNATGVVLGMGVRCTSGSLKRLYTKSASGGSITAPNLAGGDPQVSVRSAALGNPILAGQSRWYYVYYRDPTVLGGCPAISTFNATQTGRVDWMP